MTSQLAKGRKALGRGMVGNLRPVACSKDLDLASALPNCLTQVLRIVLKQQVFKDHVLSTNLF